MTKVKEFEFDYYHLLNVRIGKYEQTTVFDNDTVIILLLENIFAMSTLPNFELYMLDLR